MPASPISPLDPSVPLADLLRAAPVAEVCGVWIKGDSGCGRLLGFTEAGLSGHILIVHHDLGALLRRVPQVAVRFEGRVEVMPAAFLALCRMLDLVPAHHGPARAVAETPLTHGRSRL